MPSSASLPWEEDKKALAPPRTILVDRRKDWLDRLLPAPAEKRARAQAERDERPGALLFRSDKPQPFELLGLRIVYLVVENPTSGLSKRAVRAALERARLYPLGKKPNGQFVGIVGPYFTGSQASLRITLEEWKKANKIAIKIISGSADGVDRKTFFPDDNPARSVDPHRRSRAIYLPI